MSKKSYHHGDLRNALIEAGVNAVSDQGLQGLSLRKLAKEIGVSHNAPYQHFEDKDALIAAIAEQGFKLLVVAVDEALENTTSDPVTRLQAAHVYVNFALTHPNYYSAMFYPYDPQRFPELFAAANASFEQLVMIIADGQAAGVFVEHDVYQLAALVWSLLHGISSILVANKLPRHLTLDPETLTATFMQQLMQGIVRDDKA